MRSLQFCAMPVFSEPACSHCGVLLFLILHFHVPFYENSANSKTPPRAGKVQRLKQAKDEAEAEIRAYKEQRETEFRMRTDAVRLCVWVCGPNRID